MILRVSDPWNLGDQKEEKEKILNFEIQIWVGAKVKIWIN